MSEGPDLLASMKAGWAEKRAPYAKRIGKRVTGTGPINRVIEGELVDVGSMAITGQIRKDDGEIEHVFCRSIKEVVDEAHMA